MCLRLLFTFPELLSLLGLSAIIKKGRSNLLPYLGFEVCAKFQEIILLFCISLLPILCKQDMR